MTRFQAVPTALIPYGEDAHKVLADHQGQMVDIELLNEQDDRFRRFVFMVMGRVAKALDLDPEDFRAALLVETGHSRMVRLSNGKHVFVLQSMHRRSMTAKEMRTFWDAARTIILNLLPTLSPEDQTDIDQMLNGGVT